MKRFTVRWKETREVFCEAGVEAESEEEAIRKAQAFEVAVDETDGSTVEQFDADAAEEE